MGNECNACGKQILGGIGIGGAILCPLCAEDVRQEIDQQRSEGKQVNALGIARKIYRETHSAGDYLLRDIPKELMDAAKHRAIDDGRTVREVILAALRGYLVKK